MAAISAGISVSAGMGPGGLKKAALRNQLGSESFFMAKFTSDVMGAWVALAPRYPGDIEQHALQGDGLLVQTGSLLGISEGVDVDVKWAGLRSIVMREGSMLLRLHGHGTALIAAYGGFQRFDLADGEVMVVDSGHLVAFGDTMKIQIGPLGGVRVAMFSGEGLVAKLTGPGPVYIQTRAEQGLRSWVNPDRGHNTGK